MVLICRQYAGASRPFNTVLQQPPFLTEAGGACVGPTDRAARPLFGPWGRDRTRLFSITYSYMSTIDTKHAAFIDAVVAALADRDAQIELEHALEIAAENGWADMAHAVRCILDGERDVGILEPLEAEDRTIVEEILARIPRTRS